MRRRPPSLTRTATRVPYTTLFRSVAKRDAASARYLAEAAVSLAEQDVLARRIQREVMLGWIEVIEAQQKREVLNFLIEKLEARQSLVEDSILDGTATPADVIAIDAEISAEIGRASCRESVCQYV